MKPNKRFLKYLTETRSLLVRDLLNNETDEKEQLHQLELAYARWVTVIMFLHIHKPLVARQLVRKYERYKEECREVDSVPLPPWLYDYEHAIFIIDVNVLSRKLYSVERNDDSGGISAGASAMLACENSEQ